MNIAAISPEMLTPSFGGAIKDAAEWCGHACKVVYKEAIVPFCKAAWPIFKTCMSTLWQFLKTAPGMGTLTFLCGLTGGIVLLTVADSSLMEGDHNELERFMMRIASIVCFVFSGAALAVGIALGLA